MRAVVRVGFTPEQVIRALGYDKSAQFIGVYYDFINHMMLFKIETDVEVVPSFPVRQAVPDEV